MAFYLALPLLYQIIVIDRFFYKNGFSVIFTEYYKLNSFNLSYTYIYFFTFLSLYITCKKKATQISTPMKLTLIIEAVTLRFWLTLMSTILIFPHVFFCFFFFLGTNKDFGLLSCLSESPDRYMKKKNLL